MYALHATMTGTRHSKLHAVTDMHSVGYMRARACHMPECCGSWLTGLVASII
jgi:hypothetical protein